ncbi:MAG: FAD-dependent monooxygenase [Methylobacteriaceae bacterium]|nr:FAD-dependent monooxygenase [Methylobacteriaceae bacterium]
MAGSRREAVVAGAGIGGLTAALCLAQAGWSVAVHERSPVLEEFGAGLQLSPNATRILDRLGVVENLGGLALEPEALVVRRARDGGELARMALGPAALKRWRARYLVAHRGDLLRALLDRVALQPAIALTLDSAVRGFAKGPDGRLRIGMKRGPLSLETAADLLVGADGLRSAVRERLGLGGPKDLVFTGAVAWRALIDATRLPAALRRPDTNLWLGPRAHLVHYPLRGGAVVNAVLVVEDRRRDALDDDGWNNPGDPAVIGFEVSNWARPAAELIAAADDWRGWPLFDRPAAPHWSAGAVTLLGDAAHPMAPFLAQGAAQSIEDAAALAHCLLANDDIPTALGAYERARAPRAGRVQSEARRQAGFYHVRGAVALVRDMGLRLMGPDRLAARYDWLYGA